MRVAAGEAMVRNVEECVEMRKGGDASCAVPNRGVRTLVGLNPTNCVEFDVRE